VNFHSAKSNRLSFERAAAAAAFGAGCRSDLHVNAFTYHQSSAPETQPLSPSSCFACGPQIQQPLCWKGLNYGGSCCEAQETTLEREFPNLEKWPRLTEIYKCALTFAPRACWGVQKIRAKWNLSLKWLISHIKELKEPLFLHQADL